MPAFLYLTLLPCLPLAFVALGLSRLHLRARQSTVIILAGTIGPVVATVMALVSAFNVFTAGPVVAGEGIFYLDALSALMLAVIALVSLLAVTYSIPYLNREMAHGVITISKLGWYYFWLNLLIPAMYATVIVNSLGITWVLVEATTLVSAPLVGFYGRKESLEATWKYIIIAMVGISFALLGILLTYVASLNNLPESGASLDWTFLLKNAASLDPALMKLAFIFILVGYGTKTGLAPMHTWLPDAHSQSPSPISALLSGALLNCALYGILRFNSLTKSAVGPEFSSGLLIIFGLLSIAFVIPFMIKQIDLKRLLAYSSVEHMGIIVLAVGIGGELGYFAAALHIFNHAIAKAFMFCVAGEVTERYHTRDIRQIRGIVHSAPLLGTFLFAGTLAVTGTPPFNVFVSEFLVITGAFASHNYWAAGLALALLGVIFASMLYHCVAMAFGRANELILPSDGASTVPVHPAMSLPDSSGASGFNLAAPHMPVQVASVSALSGGSSNEELALSGPDASGTWLDRAAFRRARTGLLTLDKPSLAARQTRPPKRRLAVEHIKTKSKSEQTNNRVALLILVLPVLTLLVLGLWVPSFVQDWANQVGAVLR